MGDRLEAVVIPHYNCVRVLFDTRISAKLLTFKTKQNVAKILFTYNEFFWPLHLSISLVTKAVSAELGLWRQAATPMSLLASAEFSTDL